MNPKLDEINKRENKHIARCGGVLSVLETDDILNDLQREKICAIYEAHGKAYMGKVNYHGVEHKALTQETAYTEYTGQEVYNFDADYVVPVKDAGLAEMIVGWNADGPTAGLIDRIFNRIEEIGGIYLHWS